MDKANNCRLHSDGNPKNIAIAIPGTGYTCKEKLMRDSLDFYADMGYETLCLDFSTIPFKEIETLEEAAALATKLAMEQLSGIRLEEYRDIVLISKSLGTVVAGRLDTQLPIRPRHMLFTPLNETLAYIRNDTAVIATVLGTRDSHMNAERLRAFCAARGIPCLILGGVGHSLKYDDENATNEANRSILALLR